MSDKPISVGDLVMFTHSCCDGFRDGVTIFVVAAIDQLPPKVRCRLCYCKLPDEARASTAIGEPGAPLSWLKRIPPPSELESENRDVEITA